MAQPVKIPPAMWETWVRSLGSLVALLVKNLPAVQETQVRSLVQEDPLEKEMANPLQYPCLENLMDSGVWWAAVHWVAKSRA